MAHKEKQKEEKKKVGEAQDESKKGPKGNCSLLCQIRLYSNFRRWQEKQEMIYQLTIV